MGSSQRYRSHGVKREHKIIGGLLPILERIAALPGVDSVIPGRIRPTDTMSVPGVRLRIQTPTMTGLKLGARSARASQEVFVVTDAPGEVADRLRREGLVQAG
jgi:hypothetical protein